MKKRMGAVTITEAAVEAYRAALPGRARYAACIRGERCYSTSKAEHCVICRHHIDACSRLARALGLPPHAVNPLDADRDAPPAWASGCWASTWPAARAWRKALEAALRQQER